MTAMLTGTTAQPTLTTPRERWEAKLAKCLAELGLDHEQLKKAAATALIDHVAPLSRYPRIQAQLAPSMGQLNWAEGLLALGRLRAKQARLLKESREAKQARLLAQSPEAKLAKCLAELGLNHEQLEGAVSAARRSALLRRYPQVRAQLAPKAGRLNWVEGLEILKGLEEDRKANERYARTGKR